MRHTYVSSLVVGTGVLFAAGAAGAHHSASVAYDVDKVVTVQGVVTEVKWENPHSWVYLDVKDASGRVVKWSFEGATPNLMHRRGITPAILKPGLVLTIKAHPARAASRHAGEMTEILTSDGKTIRATLGGAEPGRGRAGRGN